MQSSSFLKHGRLLNTFGKFKQHFFPSVFIKSHQDKIPILSVSQVNIMRVNVCLCGSSLCNGLREETNDSNNSHTDTVVTNGKTWSLSNDILMLDDELNNRHQHHQRNTMRQQKFVSQTNDPMVATSKITSGYVQCE